MILDKIQNKTLCFLHAYAYQKNSGAEKILWPCGYVPREIPPMLRDLVLGAGEQKPERRFRATMFALPQCPGRRPADLGHQRMGPFPDAEAEGISSLMDTEQQL